METQTRHIGDHNYRISQLSTKPGRRLLTRLFGIISPTMAKLVGDSQVKGKAFKLSELTAAGLGSAIETLGAVIKEEDLDHFCDVLAEQTLLQTGPDKWVPLASVMEVHFAGKYDELLQWLFASLEVNYSSFFAKLGSGSGGTPAAGAPAT